MTDNPTNVAAAAASGDRSPGRPVADKAPDVQDALLDAAAKLFAEHGFKGTSVRRLAEAAGVTPAMVHYYFGNKTGLYRALLQRAFERLLPHFGATDEIESAEQMIDRMFQVAHGSLVPQPWILQLLLREVLSEETDGGFRDLFVERFASKVAGRVSGALARGQEIGELRPDLDPMLAYICLTGMVMFPLLGRPVLEQVLGRSLEDEELLADLRRTAKAIFLTGTVSRSGEDKR